MRRSFALIFTGFSKLRGILVPLIPAVLAVFLLVLFSAELSLLVTSASERVLNAFIGGVPATAEAASPSSGSESGGGGMGIFLSHLFEWATVGLGVPALIGVMLAILLGNELLRVFTEIFRGRISNRFRLGLQRRVLDSLLWEDKRSRRDAGSTRVIYSQDAGALGGFMLFGITGFLEHLIRIAIYTYGLSQLASGKGWIVAALFLPVAIGLHIIVELIFQKKEREAMSKSESSMMDHQSGAVRFFGLLEKLVFLRGERKVVNDLMERSELACESNLSYQKVSSAKSAVSGVLATVSIPVIFLLAIALKIGSPGEVIQMQMITMLLLGSVGGLMSLPSAVIQYSKPMERVLDVLETTDPGDPGSEILALRERGKVGLRVENLLFGYPGKKREILKGVNFEVAPGETVCFVAGSGGGKSTLARLLIGEWDPDGGKVEIGGYDVTELGNWHRRHLIGFLPAEQGFLKDSLAGNIVFGREGISAEQVEEAVKISHLGTIYSDLGDEVIHDPEKQLSTGERKRVGVARLVCGDEPVWIFDEPTSGLDPETEQSVAAEILRVSEPKTSLIITHDPHLFPGVKVVFMDDGEVVATGSHEELLASNPGYREVLAEAKSQPEAAKLDPGAGFGDTFQNPGKVRLGDEGGASSNRERTE